MSAEQIAEVRSKLADRAREHNRIIYFFQWSDGWWSYPVTMEMAEDCCTDSLIVREVAKVLVAMDRDLLDVDGVEEIRP